MSVENENKNLKFNSDLIEAFRLFDTDNNDVISVKELGCTLRSLGIVLSDLEFQDLLNKFGI